MGRTGPSTSDIVFYDDETVVVTHDATPEVDASIELWMIDGDSGTSGDTVGVPDVEVFTAVAAPGDGSGLAVAHGSSVTVLSEDLDVVCRLQSELGDVVALEYTDRRLRRGPRGTHALSSQEHRRGGPQPVVVAVTVEA